MNNYESYRKVQSFWMDAAPSHWKKLKNKHVFHQKKEIVGENWESFTLLTMGKGGVKPRDMDGGGKFPGSFEGYQVVNPDQIIFCLFDIDETPRTVGLSKYHGMITSAYDVFSVTESNDPQFWTYFYQTIDDHKGLRPYYTGLRKVVRYDTFMGIEVYSPPFEEQKQITRYLDKKTNQIDTLINKIEKKIEHLKEFRTSLIDHCVTKGLDPAVKLKDSGVEWIGDIPTDWDVTRLKYISKNGVQYGLNIESESYVDSGVRFLRITDINSDGSLKEKDGVYLEESSIPDGYYLNVGDVLFSRSGGTVGKSTLIDKCEEPMSFAGYLVRFSFEHLSVASYVKWLTESGVYWRWIELQIIQSTIQNVNGEKYSNFKFALPSLGEIEKINNHLSMKTKKIDRVINLHEQKLKYLAEYRQSLISSTVTGKVRVIEEKL